MREVDYCILRSFFCFYVFCRTILTIENSVLDLDRSMNNSLPKILFLICFCLLFELVWWARWIFEDVVEIIWNVGIRESGKKYLHAELQLKAWYLTTYSKNSTKPSFQFKISTLTNNLVISMWKMKLQRERTFTISNYHFHLKHHRKKNLKTN